MGFERTGMLFGSREIFLKHHILFCLFVYLRIECGLYKLEAIPARLLCPKCKGNLLNGFREVQTKW